MQCPLDESHQNTAGVNLAPHRQRPVSLKNKEYYVVELLDSNDYTKVLHNPKYTNLLDLIDECEQYQKSLLEDDINSIELV